MRQLFYIGHNNNDYSDKTSKFHDSSKRDTNLHTLFIIKCLRNNIATTAAITYNNAIITNAQLSPTYEPIQKIPANDKKNNATMHKTPISNANNMALTNSVTFSATVNLQYSSRIVA